MRRILPLLLVCSLGCGFLRSVAPEVKGCGTRAAQALAADLLPKVEAVLINGQADWRSQLDILKLRFGEALICSVETAVAHLSGGGTTAGVAVGSRALTFASTYDLAADRGREYLAQP
jgi:hypothetical protein